MAWWESGRTLGQAARTRAETPLQPPAGAGRSGRLLSAVCQLEARFVPPSTAPSLLGAGHLCETRLHWEPARRLPSKPVSLHQEGLASPASCLGEAPSCRAAAEALRRGPSPTLHWGKGTLSPASAAALRGLDEGLRRGAPPSPEAEVRGSQPGPPSSGPRPVNLSAVLL